MKKIENKRDRKKTNIRGIPDRIDFDLNLPITAKKDEIIQTIRKNRVVIISGETGSGKTTQIPKFCLLAGQGKKRLIGCTQPRRIAAINVAKRIAEELHQPLGKAVGYKIRFDDKTTSGACIKIMTDGILLAETQTDRFLNAYDTIIVDEAHERSLNIDFTLGILRRLIQKRKGLKLIMTSATIDTQKFSNAFNNAPIIEVSGRMFPVETVWAPFSEKNEGKLSMEDQGYVEAAADAVQRIVSQSRSGDILVFMPSEQDITDTMELIRGRRLPGTTLLPLYARLSAKEQSKVFSRQVSRKIIISTNVAETSLTIPGIKYVVDTGLARIPKYSPRTRTTELPVSPISQSSADQRLGRCGRVENGVCVRLFDEEDFGSRPFFTSPEILRSNLAEVILRMISLKLGDVSTFPFIDAPAPKSINDGFDTLMELGALKQQKKKSGKGIQKAFVLTRIGQIMARLPIDPKLSRILIEADRLGCLKQATVIATALAISDPRQRPADKTQAADQQHSLFKDPSSDFITLLNIWNAFIDAEKRLKSRSKVQKYCRDHFLSFKRMREWKDIHRQIIRVMKEHGIKGEKPFQTRTGTKGLKSKDYEIGGPLYIALHKSLLTGYLAHIAHKKEKNIFNAAKGQQAMIFPGSGLFDNAGNWIVAAEYVKTSLLFARTVAKIDPAWLEDIGKDLCTRSYSDPHWEKKRGEVVALEQVSLFGLIIVSNRKIAYGKINPAESGEIFIRSALVEGQVTREFEFMTHNRKLIERLETLEHKTRKKDILASEDDMYLFYMERLPKPFYNIRSFARFLKDQKSQDFLKMQKKDLQKTSVDKQQLAMFPDTLSMPEGKFRLKYRFNPGSKKDGVTINVPAESAAQVSLNQMDRLVPGLFEEKIAALIKGLPKKYRIALVPVSDTASVIASELPRLDRPLFTLLSEFIRDRYDLNIPAAVWSEKDLPDHLKMRISIRDDKDREVSAKRDKTLLFKYAATTPDNNVGAFKKAAKKIERSNITQWDFGDLESEIMIQEKDGFTIKGYPGLYLDADATSATPRLCLRLFKSAAIAENAHVKGVRHLFSLLFKEEIAALKKDINRSSDIRMAAKSFSGQGRFQDELLDLIISGLFEKNIRSKQQFDMLAEKEIPRLYATGQDVIKTITRLSKAFRECFELIQKLSLVYKTKKKTFDNLTALFTELKNLVPPGFAQLYDYHRICQLHRYVACLEERTRKMVENPLKEEKKAAKVNVYTNRLNDLLSSLSQQSSSEKTRAVEAFFWLLEEYKISVFAQHLKTNVKVSAKKMDKELVRISAMI